MEVQGNFIASIATHTLGGNLVADLITLKSGKAIAISDECLGLYVSADAFRNGGSAIGLMTHQEDSFARVEEGDEDGAVGTFVRHIGTGAPDGYDRLYLPDDRVLVVGGDAVALYNTRQQFDAGADPLYVLSLLDDPLEAARRGGYEEA